jgi:deazaflavin-dependent oxidoreductase (nitroreductase family)
MRGSCSVEEQFFRMLNRIIEPHVRAGWAAPRMVPGGLVVVETTGRRTGRRSRVPLAATHIRDYVVVSTFRGVRSQWVKNLSANPETRYWMRGRARKAKAVVVAPGRHAPDTRGLPSLMRWLVTALVPYTHAGWAFAILAPVTESPAATRSRAKIVARRGRPR